MKKKKYRGLDGRPVYDKESYHLIWSIPEYSLSIPNVKCKELRGSNIKNEEDAKTYLEKNLGCSNVNLVAIFGRTVGNSNDVIVQWTEV